MRPNNLLENSMPDESYICLVVSRINSPRKWSAARRKGGSFEFVEVGLVSSDSAGVMDELSVWSKSTMASERSVRYGNRAREQVF